jgi:ribosomal protein S18 acetylase RimI-like enzyme
VAIRIRDLTKDWRRGDAEKLARFMNEASRGWPGGAWDPATPEEMHTRFREQKRLGAFVAEVGGEIIAYCDCAAKPNEKNSAYIPLLNAHPDYHGKGVGRAVLLSSVERVYELGIARVDLHTWPGNLKAVPLYKKSGFMWAPDEQWEVLMQNFTPGARRHPVAQPFFQKHDWYRTMKRDLSLTADDHKQGGGAAAAARGRSGFGKAGASPRPSKVRVYPYEWEEDGDRLRMVYDRQSWGLLEIETNDFLVGCSLEDEKLVAGMPRTIRWQIVNHQSRPLEIALVASADDGIMLDHKRILRVEKRAQLYAQFEIDPAIRDKEQEPRAPIIRTDVIINGAPVRLEAGFEVQQAVSFGLDAVGHLLRPGRPERVIVQGFSELDHPATAKVHLRGAAGVTIEPATHEVEIPAKGSVEMPVTLTSAGSGPVQMKAEAEVKAKKQTIRPKVADLYVEFGHPGEVSGHVEKDAVWLESSLHHLRINRRGGWVTIGDKIHNRWQVAAVTAPELGPPYAWEDFFDTPCDARIERQDGRVVAVLTTQSVHRPGIWLERRITLSNLPVIEVSDTIINGSSARFEGRIKRNAQLRGDWITAMSPKGLIRSRGGPGRSGPEHDPAKEESAWPETWVAMEDDRGIAAGLLWPKAYRVHGHGWWSQLEHALPPAEPGQSVAADPIYVFVGDGDHLTVRRWWQNLLGPRLYREQGTPETRPPLNFGLRPNPLVIHGKEAQARLAVDSIGRLELDGTLRATAPAGIRITPKAAEFKAVNQDRGLARRVTVSRQSSLSEGGYFVDCAAQIDRASYRERNAIVVLGDPKASVVVSRAGDRDEFYRIDNGALALTIAPEFMGCAISLERGGEQLLRSAYPEARPLSWMNPWHGGIEPRLGSVSRDLFQEKFAAREIKRRGRQGIVWQGVRVSCAPKHERGRRDAMAIDYLLAPGSSVLAVAVRITRRADTSGWMDAGVQVWPLLGGSYADALLTGADNPDISRLMCEFGGGFGTRRWIVAESPKAGQAVIAACHPGDGIAGGLGASVCGKEGYFLWCGRGEQLEARETRESVFFVSFTDLARGRDLAEALSGLKELP